MKIQLERQLPITERLLMMNVPLSRARMNARAETKLSGAMATRIFRIGNQPRWYAYSSIKIGYRYRDTAAVYWVNDLTLTDHEAREFIRVAESEGAQ